MDVLQYKTIKYCSLYLLKKSKSVAMMISSSVLYLRNVAVLLQEFTRYLVRNRFILLFKGQVIFFLLRIEMYNSFYVQQSLN